MKKYLNVTNFLAMSLCGFLAGTTISGNPLFVNKANASDGKSAIETTYKAGPAVTANKLSEDFISVAKNVTPAVVTIYSTKIVRNQNQNMPDDPFLRQYFGSRGMPQQQDSTSQGLGSGVIISSDGIVLTNNHVIAGADSIVVTLSDKRKYKAKIIGADPRTDVAVIKIIDGKNLPLAQLGDSKDLSVGEWVLAIGNPLGLSSTVTSGIISAKGRDHVGITDFEDFIQTDAAINPGNSGGALVNLKGEVIGINTAIASKTGGYMGIGFAIPSNMARKVMSELISKGKVTRGYLGIQIQDLDENLAKNLRLNDSASGIVIGEIVKNSPADIGGLQKYDIIESVNGNDVSDATAFRNTVAANEPGDSITLKVLRDGRKINIKVRLGELENKVASNINQEDEQN